MQSDLPIKFTNAMVQSLLNFILLLGAIMAQKSAERVSGPMSTVQDEYSKWSLALVHRCH
jgi:hypothetical protein